MDGITILHSDRFRAGFYNLHDTDDGDIGFRLTDLSGGEHQIRSENISRVVRVRPSSMTRINKARLPVAGIIFFLLLFLSTFVNQTWTIRVLALFFCNLIIQPFILVDTDVVTLIIEFENEGYACIMVSKQIYKVLKYGQRNER